MQGATASEGECLTAGCVRVEAGGEGQQRAGGERVWAGRDGEARGLSTGRARGPSN